MLERRLAQTRIDTWFVGEAAQGQSMRWCARLASIVLLLFVSLSVAVSAPQSATASSLQSASTVVSLTFDDGFASQWAARQALIEHHMHGTFYIPSGFIGLEGRLGVAQLKTLQADGNEIGGHTVNHFNLPTLDGAEQMRQICDDRVALRRYGFKVTSFAYPYGAVDVRSKANVKACGYNSARAEGGLDPSSGPCTDCAYGEGMPPADRYAVRTASPVVTTTTMSFAEQHIMQAEAHGGGWVPLVFHEVCDQCSDMEISPATLMELLSWLESRAARGTVVKTVDQMVGGPVQGPMSGPVDQRPDGQLINSSLEVPGGVGGQSTGDGGSYCWQRSGYGANTAGWSRVRTAHSDTWAEQVSISSFQSGDQKLLVKKDSGTCSPAVTPDKSYTLSAWYTSTASTRMVVFYRTAAGNWIYWTASPQAPSSAAWSKLSWQTPTVPSDATRLSFGLQLASVGTLTTDDYSIAPPRSTWPFLPILAAALLLFAVVPTMGYIAWTRVRTSARRSSPTG